MKLHRRTAGLLAGLCCLIAAPAALAAGPADVTVRVEGAAGTLREQSPVRTTLTPVNKSGKPGEECTGTSAAGALEQATGGNWGGSYSSFGYSVDRIFGESYPFGNANGDFWSFWVNNKQAPTGVCGYELQQGDEVLFFVDRCADPQPPDFACKNQPVLPLELRASAGASAGAPTQVTVVRYDAGGNAAAVDGAHVTGPGIDATTGGGGKATLTFPQGGDYRLKAAKDGFARSAGEDVHVSAAGQAPPAPASGPDTTAPVGRILGIRSGQRFKRKRAPRNLHGKVSPDPSGLRAVKLSLTRSARGHCQLYSPTKERFRRSRCGRRVNFRIGDRENWSYLLPKRLGKGRYVLDVIAVDKAGNRDKLARGRNRVVFFVR